MNTLEDLEKEFNFTYPELYKQLYEIKCWIGEQRKWLVYQCFSHFKGKPAFAFIWK
jgi:hypothetical protein